MNNFITRVAQRAVGTASVVQPLLASRYAPPLEVSMPAALPLSDPPSANPAKRTSDVKSLSEEDLPSSTANQDVRPAKSGDGLEFIDEPLQAPASPSQSYAQKQSLGQPSQDVPIKSHAATEASARPLVDEIEQSAAKEQTNTTQAETQTAPANFSDAGVARDHSDRQVQAGPIAAQEVDSYDLSRVEPKEERESEGAVSRLRSERGGDGEANSPRGQVLLEAPGIASQGEVSFAANDARGTQETERSGRPTSPLNLETIDQERSLEERPTKKGRLDQPNAAPRADQSLFDQSLTRGIDQHLRLPREVGEEHGSSEKIIRVTIGRIEVRAVTPPAAPVEPPATPTPRLSLDEFLRQHNGRRR